MATVNIVTSDRGWILERLASEITSRLDYVRHTDVPDPAADINYYITYSCWSGRVSRIELAWFAHLEPMGEVRERFFRVATAMDHCLTQARLYEDMLRDHGVTSVSTISPGVDLDLFTPRLKIGVVGRAYHTGRKGEHLVGQLVDMPEIDWHFTGTGWPGPALELPDEDMPKFYRDMDYILVPSLYEGGPMCVVEALASGTEVISSPVGWVPDFPHIEFETGNVDDLRRVLLELYAKKNRLRETVLDRTWDAWALGHHALFQDLVAKNPDLAPDRRPVIGKPTPSVRLGRTALLMHGNEASSQGGPSVRVPRTARELNRLGMRAEALSFNDTDLSGFDLVHTFNVWAPQSALKSLRQAKRQGKTSIFSPIFLDLSERQFWDTELLDVFRTTDGTERIDAALASVAQRWIDVRLNPAAVKEPMGGYFAMVREMVALADHLILLSDKERELLTAIGAELSDWSIVHNPTDNAAFKAADPNLFGETYGFKDFVLCVGRVEARKNQLMLAHALRDTGIPLVLIGHTPSKDYRELIERHGGENVHFLGRLQAGSDLLLSAFRAARVATLPSWSEGAPLAALEASAAGAALVLSDRSSEPEYFGSFARYANPADPRSIRQSILDAYESPRTAEMREQQIAHVAAHFSWAAYTSKTRQVYETAVEAKAARTAAAVPAILTGTVASAEGQRQRIIFDLTTSIDRSGRWTGIARVEMSLAIELAKLPDVDLRYVQWDNKRRRFLDVPAEAVAQDELQAYREPQDGLAAEAEPGALFIVVGSGWMQNAVYAEGAIAFAQRIGAELTVVIHDLIPVIFPYWFNDEYVPVFERNMRAILSNADRIVAISETTKQDVQAVLRRQVDLDTEVVTFREGDQIGSHEVPVDPVADPAPPVLERFAGTAFVIAVGAIHARKNHKILYDVWVRLAEQLGGRCPTLLIVGGVAWNGADLARSIKSDRRLRGKIVLLDEVDDVGLSWLYRNCIFTAYPSLYEGWGLPVCESLRYGKICLASNASSIQEIAPDVTDLLDPLDFAAWYTRIRFYATSAEARRQRERAIRLGYRPTPWSESAAELSRKLRAPLLPDGQKGRYHLGATLSFAAGQNLRAYVRGLWHISEPWGAWSAGKAVGIEVFLPTRPVQDLVLAMKVRAVPPAGGQLDVAVSVNGRLRTTWTIHNHVFQMRFVSIEKDAVDAEGHLRIDLENAELFTVSETTSSATDTRAVGIGVQAAILTEAVRATDLRAVLDPKGECGDPVRPGDYVSLIDGRRSSRMIGGDWQKSSAWGVWPDSPNAKLYAQVEAMPPRRVRLRFTLRAVATATQPLAATVLANGIEAATWQFDDSGMVERDVVISPAAQAIRQPVELSFVPATRCSPRERGVGQEERPLSLGIFDVAEATAAITARPLAASAPAIEMGETIDFRPGNQTRAAVSVANILTRGWYGLENTGIWSRGSHSQLAFRFDRVPDSGVIVYLAVRTFGTKQAGPLRLTVDVNGRFSVDHLLSTDGQAIMALDLPADAIEADKVVWLTFRNDRALAPSSVGKSKDDRLLGIQLVSFDVQSAFQIEPFRSYAVGTDPSLGEIFHEGWHPPEAAGRWSKPGPAHLRCVVDASGEEAATLLCGARVYGAASEGSVTVDVLSQGKHLSAWTFDDDENQSKVLQVPLHPVGQKRVLDLTFVRSNAVSPASLGVSDDMRELGLWIGSLELLTRTADRLAIGQRIEFLGPGPNPSLLRGKWDKSASWGAWPAAASSSINLAVDPGRSDIGLDFVLRPVASPIRPQSVAVLVNGVKVDSWQFNAAEIESRRLDLPTGALDGRPIEVRFTSSDKAASPADLAIGREKSAFPLGIYEMRVTSRHTDEDRTAEPPRLMLDEDLEFNQNAISKTGAPIQQFLQDGWFGLESTGVWSRGRVGRMAFHLDRRIRTRLAFTLVMRTMASRARPVDVTILLDDVPVVASTFTDGNWRDLASQIPADALSQDRVHSLTFRSDKAVAPSSNGRSGDDRLLGLQVARLKISHTSVLQTGRPYTGSGDLRVADLCVEGWHYPEESGLWSKQDGHLIAPLAEPGADRLRVTVTMRVFGTERTGPAQVDLVGPDGAVIDSWEFLTDDVETRSAVVPVTMVDQAGVLDVRFRRQGAISPTAIGIADARLLGVWLSSLQADPVTEEADMSALASEETDA